MKIVLNLLPLKIGGGVQVALDFIAQAKEQAPGITWRIVCRTNMPFIRVAGSNVEISHVVEDSLHARLHFEFFGCRAYVAAEKPDAIFTLFGPQWPGVDATNIVGCAYSNLFYPELDFWGALPRYRKLLKHIVDAQRLRRLRAADVRIFETMDLARRAVKQCGFNPDSVHVVNPACSSLVTLNGEDDITRERCKLIPAGYRVVIVSGYHPNKNIDLLILAARELKLRGLRHVRFILTLPPDNPGARQLLEMAELLGVSDQVFNIGPVPQHGCCELYRVCDAAVLPSTLESFSNMIVESWAMKKPLLISDLDWCRSLCGEGALYFKYRNAADLADKIETLLGGSVAEPLIEAGIRQLSTYPDSAGRFAQYVSVIESAVTGRKQPCLEI